MRRVVQASVLAVMMGSAAVAGEPMFQVSYPGDAQMDCAALSSEIARMEGIMGISSQAAASAQGGARAAELGATVGVNAALYSGALGSVPGLGLFGNAAAGMAKQRAAAKEAQAKEQIRTAETRRAMLMGMYAGKACGAPAPVVVAETPAAPVTAEDVPVEPVMPAAPAPTAAPSS